MTNINYAKNNLTESTARCSEPYSLFGYFVFIFILVILVSPNKARANRDGSFVNIGTISSEIQRNKDDIRPDPTYSHGSNGGTLALGYNFKPKEENQYGFNRLALEAALAYYGKPNDSNSEIRAQGITVSLLIEFGLINRLGAYVRGGIGSTFSKESQKLSSYPIENDGSYKATEAAVGFMFAFDQFTLRGELSQRDLHNKDLINMNSFSVEIPIKW